MHFLADKQHLSVPEYFHDGGAETFYSPVIKFSKDYSEKLKLTDQSVFNE